MIVCLHSTFMQELCERARLTLEKRQSLSPLSSKDLRPGSGTGVRRDSDAPCCRHSETRFPTGRWRLTESGG